MASKNLMQMSTDIVKLDRFDGGSFKHWQKKMQFLLATLKVAYVLTKPYPEESKDETLAASRERLKFENDDFICRGHILNAMSDPLFDVYQNYSTAKELWNALEERYFTKDATNTDKLPSTWKDVKKNLKHRKDDLSLKDLGKHLLIEEQYRLENKTNDDTSKVHVCGEKGAEKSSKAGVGLERNVDTMTRTKRIKKMSSVTIAKSQDISSENARAFSLEERNLVGGTLEPLGSVLARRRKILVGGL
ncbi:hypothetical protein Tco_0630253 [Tanacetum coccineum]